MQGDCLSAILFIFYLARALDEHGHSITSNQTLQEYQNNATFTVQPKYADDITYASTSYTVINHTTVTVPEKLNKIQPPSKRNQE